MEKQEINFLNLGKHKESAFVSLGFSGHWNKALEKFRKYNLSDTHRTALYQWWSALNSISVICQLSNVREERLATNRLAANRLAAKQLHFATKQDTRKLFLNVENLVRLILVLPHTTATA